MQDEVAARHARLMVNSEFKGRLHKLMQDAFEHEELRDMNWIVDVLADYRSDVHPQLGQGTWHVIDRKATGDVVAGVLWSFGGQERVATRPEYNLPLDPTEFTSSKMEIQYVDPQPTITNLTTFLAYACPLLGGKDTKLTYMQVTHGSTGTHTCP